MAESADPEGLSDLVLSGPLRWTRGEVAEQAGMPMETASALWGALGFPQAGPNERAYSDGDVAALTGVHELIAAGDVDLDDAVILARSMGRSLARLAEGQLDSITAEHGFAGVAEDGPRLLPALEALLVYVWRRHLLAAAERRLARPDPAQTPLAVGFVDLVGYTARTRDLDRAGLTALLRRFEEGVHERVVEACGRIVKTIGDEVMWIVDDPAVAARCALALAEDLLDPPVRVGVAWGSTLPQGGDHFGPVVNIAARLTEVARVSSVLVDRGLATQLEGEPEFDLLPLRPIHVRGYDHLVATRLRRARSRRG